MAKVLVVDDEEDIRTLVRLNLQLDGHEVVTASDGAEALHTVRSTLPDVVVLDVMMPELDGWTVLGRLKDDEPAISGIPVVMLTALEAPMDKVRGGIEGAVRYLTKPIDMDELRSAVAEALADDEHDARKRAQHGALAMLARIERNDPAADSADAVAPRPRLSGLERDRRTVSPTPRPQVSTLDPARVAELTEKQRDLLEAIGREPTVMAAAERLAMSRSNIYASLRRIGRRMGAASVSELVELARRTDWPD